MNNNKINYKAIAAIIVSSIILGFIYNTFSNDGIDIIRKPIIVKYVNIGEDNDQSGFLRGINLVQAIDLYNDNSTIFIDARDQWDFSEMHIKGAINIPEFSFTKNDTILKIISPENLLVVYCEGDDCDISKRLANELIKLGYINTYVFMDGINSWIEAQLPVEKGNENE